MLDDAERAELEEYRRRDKAGYVFASIFAGLVLLFFVGFTTVAYKADAFFYSTDGHLSFGVDIMKMAKYYRGQSQKAEPVSLGFKIPLPASAASEVLDVIPFPVEPPPIPAEK